MLGTGRRRSARGRPMAFATAAAATVDPTAWYVLVNRNSGKTLDVSAVSTADGAQVQQWSRTDGTNQQFRLADSADGYVRLIDPGAGGDYLQLPWRMGLLTQTNSPC